MFTSKIRRVAIGAGPRRTLTSRTAGCRDLVTSLPSLAAAAVSPPVAAAAAGKNSGSSSAAKQQQGSKGATSKGGIVGSYVLQRNAVVHAELDPFSKKFVEYQKHLEAGPSGAQLPQDLSAKVRQADLERREVQLAPRTTEDDASGNKKTLNRALDRTLYFVIKEKSSDTTWKFPTAVLGESIAAHKTLEKLIGERHPGKDFEAYMVGPYPFCHRTSGSETTFFFKAQMVHGQFAVKKELCQDFAWVTRQELKDYLDPAVFASVYDGLSDFQ